MIDVFAVYATDDALETAGAKMPLDESSGLIVARMNNDKYLSQMAAAYELNKEVLDREDDAAGKVDREITLQVQAETILVGFYGRVGYKGKSLKYSVEAAKKLLGIKDLRMKIMGFAIDRENYRIKAEAADTKK